MGEEANVTENPASDFLLAPRPPIHCSDDVDWASHLIMFMQSMVNDHHNGMILLMMISRR